jgi:hypothetical protein
MHKRKTDPVKANRNPPTRPMSRSRKPLALAVAHRRQAHEEQRQFEAAIDGFLTEWVRQHLGPQG